MAHTESSSYNIYSDPHHSFSMQLAQQYGIECAILIHHFQHWISVNKRLNRNFHEGKTWTYQTQDEISAIFPYWSRDSVQYFLKKLVELEILVKGNFNKTHFDRTQWYAFKNENIFTKVENSTIENEKGHDRIQKRAQPIPDIITNTKTNRNICADDVDAPKPKKSQEKKKIERIARRKNVHTSEEEDKNLEKKLGSRELLEKCYDHLSAWKESISEKDPKASEKHTDYYRIPKWVVKAVKESEEKVSSTKQSTRENVLSKFKHSEIYNGAECFIDEFGIAFQRGMTHGSVKFKDLGFDEQLSNLLRKFGIQIK